MYQHEALGSEQPYQGEQSAQIGKRRRPALDRHRPETGREPQLVEQRLIACVDDDRYLVCSGRGPDLLA